MESKLGLHDLLARLVPGGAFLWALSWILTSAGLEGIPKLTGGIAETAAFVLVAYVAGVALDSVGRWTVEAALYKIIGRPSSRFLVDHPGVGESEREHYRNVAQTLVPKRSQITFDGDGAADNSHFVCRRAIALYGSRTEKMLSMSAQYGMHRTLVACCFVLQWLSVVLAVVQRLSWWPAIGLLGLGALFFFGTNHWGFNVCRTAMDLADEEFRKRVESFD
ncbi:MAG: hypothetical protein U0R49_09135 [Fimbriimonadales bacterium]